MRVLLTLLVSLFALAARAEVSYEGQPVQAIDLVTSPSIDVEQFRPLVTLKAGEPYSGDKIKASIEALKKTGQFKDVDLQITPEPEGLHVLLVLEPAYYYGVLTFRGSRGFSYVRLLQVANLPDQDPFVPSQVEKAQVALEDFFRKNGYFRAEVSASLELYEKEGLANVIFVSHLAKRARIGAVKIDGPQPEDTARLLRASRSLHALAIGASIAPGKSYTPRRIEAAQNVLKSYLTSHRHLANKIQVGPPQYHADTDRVDVTFNIDEGPLVDIKITGARLSWIPFLSSRQQKKLIPLYEEGTFDQDLVEEGKRNLISFFQSKGYFDVQVKTAMQKQPDQISLVYDIDKGKRHKVEDIAFHGNRHISGDELLEHVAVEKHHFFSRGKFSDKLLRKSVNNLESVYRDHGYEQVSVEPHVVDNENKIGVSFEVTEGPQTTVEAVNFKGNSKFDVAALTPHGGFMEKTGAPFSPHKMAQDRGQILAVYLDHGYLNTEVKTVMNRHPDDQQKVDINYQIKEGPQILIESVPIVGQNTTRTSFISKTANLSPNAPLSQGSLLRAESELYNLGVFDWASVGPRRPITDQSKEEAVVKVHESRRNSITYGFGIEVSRRGGNTPTGTVAVPGLPTVGLGNAQIQSSEETFVSPRGSVEFTRKNIRGLGETGAISLLLSRLDQRAIATYADPKFRGSSWSTLFSLSAERDTQNPLFAARLENVAYQFERALNQRKTMTAQIRYSFGKTDLSDLLVPELVLPQDRSVRLSTFSGTFIRDTRDKPLDAHRGFYQTADLGVTPRPLGSSADFTRFLTQTAYYKGVGGGIVWANSIRLGLAKAYGGDTVPTSERFFAGGGTTLRGFPVNGAGPQRVVPFCSDPADSTTCVNVTVPVGGNQLFIFNSEGRFPLPFMKNLGAVVFYDGGNVYQNINFRQFVDDFTNTVGVGIRYNTPVGPVRFDIGRNLNPITGFRATQFFVTLGQAF